MAAILKRKRETEPEIRQVRKASPAHSDVTNEDGDESGNVAEEEEEWGGVGDVNKDAPMDVDDGKPSRAPTGVQVREMKEAANLFRSSSFKLQIDELLPNVRLKEKHRDSLEQFLLSFHTFLTNIPASSPAHPLEAARPLLKKGISVPYSFPLPSEESNWKVAFEPPSVITLAGSWNNKTSVKGMDGKRWGIDFAVEMPGNLFQEKDYLNSRFFHKRAFYLAKLAAAITDKKSGLQVDCAYQSLGDNPRLTKLVVQPQETKLKVEICIIPVLSPASPIAFHRLSPSSCNVRDETRTPTPLYNTAMLTTLTPPTLLLSVHTWQQEAPAYTDALSLLRVWANQRGFSEGSAMQIRGFEGKGPWWASLLGMLILGEEANGKSKRKPLGRGLSSYQLFKAALDFISSHDFEKQPVYVKTNKGHNYALSEYQDHHSAVFVDASSRVNMLNDVPLGSLDLLKMEAKKTLSVLGSATPSLDPFADAFLQDRRTLATRFDAIVRIDLSTSTAHETDTHTVIDHGSPHNALLAVMSARLREGLGNRTKAVTFIHPTPLSRPLSQALPSNPHILYLGLVYDSEHAFRQVDHGPDAKDPDPENGARFRALWGDKAELRMFKDGKILESVVWDVKTADEKSHLPIQVVNHLLDIHFGIKGTQTWHSSFDELIRLPTPLSKMYAESKLTVGFKGALTAFDELVKNIKALPEDELPLHILNFVPVSPSLRYTSTFAPVPRLSSLPPNASYIHAMPLIVQFEKSARWPDDLKAIKTMKLAFFERIAATLMNAISGLTASVVVDASEPTLEVLTANGWAFAIYIWHDREVTLLDRVIKGDNSHIQRPGEKKKKGPEYHQALAAKEYYLRHFIHAPRHHRAISKLHHVFPSFSGTTRLVKRWFATHWLLDGHVSEEAIELLCAYIFVRPGWEKDHDMNPESSYAANVPASKERGFAMVMEFFQRWQWEDGLSVPLYDSADILEEMDVVVGLPSEGVWAIKTDMDKSGSVWTAKGPDAIVARRVQVLAQATWAHLKTMESSGADIGPLFTHPTLDYHFLIKLDPMVLPRYHQNVHVDVSLLSRRQGHYSNLQADDSSDTPVRIGFDPAQVFFRDLQATYANTFRIFWDSLGGDMFGGVWDPTLSEPRPFKVMGAFSSIPCPQEVTTTKSKVKDLVTLNRSSVLQEIGRLGSGLMKNITVPSDK